MAFFGWTFGILATIAILAWIGKQVGSAYPVGCGVVVIIFIILFVSTCNDMNEEREENKAWNEARMEKLEREMKETEYMRTPEYQHKEYMKKYWHEEE